MSKSILKHPHFQDINLDNTEQQLSTLLNQNREKLQQTLAQPTLNWHSLMTPMESLSDDLEQFWSPISHLHGVMNSEKLRDVYHRCLPKLSEYSTELGHNKKLYDAIQAIKNSDEYHQLDTAQKKIIDNNLRDFTLAGVALDDDKKKRFMDINIALSKLSTEFDNNVLDATHAWHKHITDEALLSGIPQDVIHHAKQIAIANDKEGWVFSLEMPIYIALITYADNAALRREMYEAYNTRASDQGPNKGKWDNSPIMQQILTLRLELAQLLGFTHYAELSLATKMVDKPQDVIAFLNQLANASKQHAQKEFDELTEFAKTHLQIETLHAWDVTYASEKRKQHCFALSEEALRPYFPIDTVLSGLFHIVEKLFHITIKPITDHDVWHKDVRSFVIYNDKGDEISAFYMDLFARPHKRGGAWMDDAVSRRRLQNGDLQLPIAYVTCNFQPAVNDQPALLRHDEVVTLFHEFGHALQHMLTQIDYIEVSGINGVPWDAVEVASQFLENWAWQPESISLISSHFKTGEPLPTDLLHKMMEAKNFQSALMMLRQIEFALFDFRLHMEFDPNIDNQIQQILNDVRDQIAVIKAPEFNRFQHGFSHIFAGGYAAGYYSYKWAEVMAADAFSLFKENGIFDADTSQRFATTIMEQGGAVEPAVLFREFRGRDPKVEALLEASGITPA